MIVLLAGHLVYSEEKHRRLLCTAIGMAQHSRQLASRGQPIQRQDTAASESDGNGRNDRRAMLGGSSDVSGAAVLYEENWNVERTAEWHAEEMRVNRDCEEGYRLLAPAEPRRRLESRYWSETESTLSAAGPARPFGMAEATRYALARLVPCVDTGIPQDRFSRRSRRGLPQQHQTSVQTMVVPRYSAGPLA